MMNESAFLHAIREAPNDDAPRLICADWLDDHGGPAGEDRAAFIRAQVELARRPLHDPGRPVLEDLADDLLARHEHAWAAAISGTALEWQWRRGFIERVTLTADSLVERGQEVLAAAPVREVRLLLSEGEAVAVARCPALVSVEGLDLSVGAREGSVFRGRYFRDPTLLALLGAPLPALRRLYLGGQGVETRGVQELIHKGLLDRLEVLDLDSCRAVGDRAAHLLGQARAGRLVELHAFQTNFTASGARALLGASWPALRQLQLDLRLLRGRTGDPAEVVRTVLASPLLPRLESLDFSMTPLPAAALRELLASPRLGPVSRLSLIGSLAGTEEAEVLAGAPGLGRLHALHAAQCRLKAAGVQALAHSAVLGELRELGLGANDLGDAGVMALADSPLLARLTWLDLSINRVAAPGLRALLPGLGPLRELDLSNNFIGPGGAEMLAGCAGLRKLRSLALDSCNLGAAGAHALASSPHLSRLRVLSLTDNRLADEGVQALAASPHLARLQELHLDDNGLGTPAVRALVESPYLGRVRRLGLGAALFSQHEQEQLRARFGEGVQF